uniref:Uncharacterized protein n=1 Tax=Anguilla anguilla TaxID=7936 RepID=A0A0E9XFM5_ANGAN
MLLFEYCNFIYNILIHQELFVILRLIKCLLAAR